MKKLPNNFHSKTIEEKSQYFHSLSDEEMWDITPSVFFLFYYTKKDDDEPILEKHTIYKYNKYSLSYINQVEKWYGFLKWDDVLGSQKIVNHIKSL
jgi:hypothetical protein